MLNIILRIVAASFFLINLNGCTSLPVGDGDSVPLVDTQLVTFSDQQEILDYMKKVAQWDEYALQGRYGDQDGNELQEVVVTGSRIPPPQRPASDELDSITNNQEGGVDEGDIVKRVGDYLVVLKRGRLFSFSLPLNGRNLAAINYINISQDNNLDAWYDEILAYRQQIVLLGYSYEIDASIVQLFSISDDGVLSNEQTYAVKSSDYFDPENYSTRLVGDTLVISLSVELDPDALELQAAVIENGKVISAAPLFNQQTIYPPIIEDNSMWPDRAFHTIARCPLSAQALSCTATTIIGPNAKLSYTSLNASYLWLEGNNLARDYFAMDDRTIRQLGRARGKRSRQQDDPEYESIQENISIIYRIPLDDEPAGAVLAKGEPLNQFSFRETEEYLQVLTRGPHLKSDDEWLYQTTLVSIAENSFAQLVQPIEESSYRTLGSHYHGFHVNRFIGNYVTYVSHHIDEGEDSENDWFFAFDLTSDVINKEATTRTWKLDHGGSRIETMGERAIIIGGDYSAALGFSSWDFSTTPRKGHTSWLYRAYEADERSHSFNYRLGSNAELFAFPVTYAPETELYHDHWPDEETTPISTAFFQFSDDLSMTQVGELTYSPNREDNCLVSCTDWYGDSRPFFIGDKLYALMGYEIVEAVFEHGSVIETARVNGLDLLNK